MFDFHVLDLPVLNVARTLITCYRMFKIWVFNNLFAPVITCFSGRDKGRFKGCLEDRIAETYTLRVTTEFQPTFEHHLIRRIL